MFPFSDRGHLSRAEPGLVLGCLLSTLARGSELYPSLQCLRFFGNTKGLESIPMLLAPPVLKTCLLAPK